MSVRRVLVDCAVLSLQDSCVFYPCCKCCFSRIEVDQRDTTRYRCFKCGYSCLKEQLDHRYRLSLKVTRDRSIFGVTVFGTCLNPFFGIHAGGLQRLLDDAGGPVGSITRSKLLVKAVEDCFIGRHFIFGIKVTGTDGDLWSGRPVAKVSSNRDPAQFIASQMILPKALERSGCSVLNYYRVLLRQAEEPTDTSISSRPTSTALLLLPRHSPASTFNNTSLSVSGFLSQSLQRSLNQDCPLTPTPPWQQSLGLVTSSAEQDEGCSTQEGSNESSQMKDFTKTSHPYKPRHCLKSQKFTEETTLSPIFSYNRLSFSTYPDSSIEQSTVNASTPARSPSSSQSIKKDFSLSCIKQIPKAFLSTSFAWDDLPFSESLSEFLCEKENVAQTETHSNLKNVEETAGENLEKASQDKKSHSHIKTDQSQLLEEITSTSAPNVGGDRHDVSDRALKIPKEHVKSSTDTSICPVACDQHDVVVRALSFENEEEQPEEDAYNCSADLFSRSLAVDVSTTRLNSDTDTIRLDTNSKNEWSDLSCVARYKPKLKSYNCLHTGSYNPPAPVDFMPPSQSTPNVKLTSLSKSVTPGKRFWEADRQREHLLAKQYRRVPTEAPDSEPNENICQKCDISICDETLCDYGHNEVPPTPAANSQLNMRLRRIPLSDNSSSKVDSTCEGLKEDGDNCKRTQLNSIPSLFQRSMSATRTFIDEVVLEEPNNDLHSDDNPLCDCSRDLFSDSL